MAKVILATASYDATIRFWDTASGSSSRSIPFAESQVNRLAITPDKNYLAVAANPLVKFFEINSPNNASVTTYEGHTQNVTAVGFQRDGKWMYTGSEDGTIKIWDLRAAGCQREYEHGSPLNSVALHPNQAELVSGAQNGSVKVWDLAANKMLVEQIPDGETAVRSVSIAPDASQLVVANNKGMCFVWKLVSGGPGGGLKPLVEHKAHQTYILKAQYSPDAKLLATASADSTVKIWRVDEKGLKPYKVLSGHQRWVWDCMFSSDSGYLVSASSDHTARLWAMASGETIRHYTNHHKAVTCVALADN